MAFIILHPRRSHYPQSCLRCDVEIFVVYATCPPLYMTLHPSLRSDTEFEDAKGS